MSLTIGSLFSGYGGLDLAVQALYGGDVAWHCDTDKDASRVLAHNFARDYRTIANLGNITTARWKAAGHVDILCGGFPCQDLSHAGRRAGIRPDTRSGLWLHFAYAIEQTRPRMVVIENVRGILSAKTVRDTGDGRTVESDGRALGRVLADLAGLGYDARWCSLRACDVGAPHARRRVFVVATATDAEPLSHVEHRDTGRLAGPQSGGAGPHRDTPLPGASGGPALHRGGSTDLPSGPGTDSVEWGPYRAAVKRWETVLGRPAPPPTEPDGRPSLLFVEWMMGLPQGHVTDVPARDRVDSQGRSGPRLSRQAQGRILGNGVVPQQAMAAIRYLAKLGEKVSG